MRYILIFCVLSFVKINAQLFKFTDSQSLKSPYEKENKLTENLVEDMSQKSQWLFQEKLQVYPIPAHSEITIQYPEDIPIEKFEIVSSNGMLISKHFQGGNSLTINHLPKGNYFLLMYTALGIYVQKFLKE